MKQASLAKQVVLWGGLGLCGIGVFYLLGMGLWGMYWEQKCLRVGFLGVAVSYKYEVYCQDGNKSVRIEPWKKTTTDKTVNGSEVK